MRKPRIEIRALCVLQKAEIDIQFVFNCYSTIKSSNSSVSTCEFFIVFGPGSAGRPKGRSVRSHAPHLLVPLGPIPPRSSFRIPSRPVSRALLSRPVSSAPPHFVRLT
jgi:hypothetical protein